MSGEPGPRDQWGFVLLKETPSPKKISLSRSRRGCDPVSPVTTGPDGPTGTEVLRRDGYENKGGRGRRTEDSDVGGRTETTGEGQRRRGKVGRMGEGPRRRGRTETLGEGRDVGGRSETSGKDGDVGRRTDASGEGRRRRGKVRRVGGRTETSG